MKSTIKKNIWFPTIIIIAEILLTFLGLIISIIINDWIPAMILIILALLLLPSLFIFNNSAIIYNVLFKESGIDILLFKKHKYTILWENIDNIKIGGPFRNGNVICIYHENKITYIDYRNKSKELFLKYCPMENLLTEIKSFKN